MSMFEPVNDLCLNCETPVNPFAERQEIAFDDENQCRRRCGSCIAELKRMAVSTTTGHIDPNKHGRFG